jgi:uncharacterized protein DUF3995
MVTRLPPLVAAGGLGALAGLHLVWATGSPWPMTDGTALADAMAGGEGGASPGPAACVAVAGLLGTASALVAGRPRRFPRMCRAGSTGVVAVLATRGALGLLGRTDLVSPGSVSPRFRRLDRRRYSPLCLLLAALALPATQSRA